MTPATDLVEQPLAATKPAPTPSREHGPRPRQKADVARNRPRTARVEDAFAATKPPVVHGETNQKALHIQALRTQLARTEAEAVTPAAKAAARKLKRAVDAAESTFVLDFMRLVRREVKKGMASYIPRAVPPDECFAAALLGLTVALREWEPERCCFSHVAHLKVWGELNRLVRDHKIIRGRSSIDGGSTPNSGLEEEGDGDNEGDFSASNDASEVGSLPGGWQIIGGVRGNSGERRSSRTSGKR